jgi:hypothetical protein
MKKSKEITLLQNEMISSIENFDILINQYLKKIKKEYSQILIDEKHKLINNIAEGENLDVNFLKTKYLKSKELNSVSGIKNSTIDENEDLLDKTIINNETYYFENKEKGKVFNSSYNHVGYYKNSNIVFI